MSSSGPRSKRRSGSVSSRLLRASGAPRKRLLVPRPLPAFCWRWWLPGQVCNPAARFRADRCRALRLGAEIEVDGRKCVTPNCSFKLSPGATYSVKAGLKGYVSSSQSVDLTNDQTISFELAQETPGSTHGCSSS